MIELPSDYENYGWFDFTSFEECSGYNLILVVGSFADGSFSLPQFMTRDLNNKWAFVNSILPLKEIKYWRPVTQVGEDALHD